MENRFKVSVIVPVYNVEPYLKKCLQSIETQTLENFEIILVNDGSQDNCPQIIDEFKQGSKHSVRCIHKKNAGLSAARNDGIKVARGEFVTFIDSDDYVQKDYLDKLYHTAVENDSESVLCGYVKVDENGEIIYQSNHVRRINKEVVPAICTGMYIACCHLFKRELIIRNNIFFPEGKLYEDTPFVLQTRYIARNPIMIDYDGYMYLQRNGSIIHSGIKVDYYPFKDMRKAICNSVKHVNKKKYQSLEFDVLYFFAGFLFRYCRKCDKKTIDVFMGFLKEITETYFPRYYRNIYINPFKVKRLPFVNRMAVWVFVILYRMGMLKGFTKIITRL